MLTDLEELQHANIKLPLSGGRERIPTKPEGTGRERKCAATARIEASQRVDRPFASDDQNRSRFNVAEQLRDRPRGLLALFLICEWEFKSPAEDNIDAADRWKTKPVRHGASSGFLAVR
jgi:hypothetical protein